MICMYGDSHLCTLTMIIYTCACIPFFHTVGLLSRIFTYLINPHRPISSEPGQTPSYSLDLTVSRFQDLEIRGGEERCAICLTEFENDDAVSRLGRCGHVFHAECMEEWLDRCRFTCPLCRSLVLHLTSPPSPRHILPSTSCPAMINF